MNTIPDELIGLNGVELLVAIRKYFQTANIESETPFDAPFRNACNEPVFDDVGHVRWRLTAYKWNVDWIALAMWRKKNKGFVETLWWQSLKPKARRDPNFLINRNAIKEHRT